MKNKIKSNFAGLMLLLVVLAEIGILLYLNIFHTATRYDGDFAKIVRHGIEIVRNRTLFIENWFYPSTAEFDCPMLIAAFIYMITGKVFAGYAVANIINIALWIFVTWGVMERIDLKIESRLVFFSILFAVYGMGIIEYTNMLFFRGGQYVYKVLIPIMFVAVLLMDSSNNTWRDKIKKIAVYFIFAVLLLITGISSGTYVLLCGILPVVICVGGTFFSNIKESDVDRRSVLKRMMIITAATIVISVIGIAIGNQKGLTSNGEAMNLRIDFNFTQAFAEVVDYYFILFKVFPWYEVGVASLEGIGYVIKFVLSFLILFGLLASPFAFGIKNDNEATRSQKGFNRQFAKGALISIFLWNSFVLILTTSSHRYHLMGVIPLMLCAAIVIEELMAKNKEAVKNAFYIFYAMMMIVFCVTSKFTISRCLTAQDAFYAEDPDVEREVLSSLDELGVNTVFFSPRTDDAECLRVIDTDRLFETYIPGSRTVKNCDFYFITRDRSSYEDKNVILVNGYDYESLEDYIRDNYREVKNTGEYMILYSEHNPIDGISMVVGGRETIDLPTTCGYSWIGNIGAEGYLTSSDEGNILVSGDIEAKIPFDYKLFYQYNDGAGEGSYVGVDIYCDGEYVESHELSPSESHIEAHLDKAGIYSFVVYKQGTESITIKEMSFYGDDV